MRSDAALKRYRTSSMTAVYSSAIRRTERVIDIFQTVSAELSHSFVIAIWQPMHQSRRHGSVVCSLVAFQRLKFVALGAHDSPRDGDSVDKERA